LVGNEAWGWATLVPLLHGGPTKDSGWGKAFAQGQGLKSIGTDEVSHHGKKKGQRLRRGYSGE